MAWIRALPDGTEPTGGSQFIPRALNVWVVSGHSGRKEARLTMFRALTRAVVHVLFSVGLALGCGDPEPQGEMAGG
jgi:hypothetical protein